MNPVAVAILSRSYVSAYNLRWAETMRRSLPRRTNRIQRSRLMGYCARLCLTVPALKNQAANLQGTLTTIRTLHSAGNGIARAVNQGFLQSGTKKISNLRPA